MDLEDIDEEDLEDFASMFGGLPAGFPGQGQGRTRTGQGTNGTENKRKEKKDLYQVLEVEKEATAEQIKKAYKVAAVKYHPDKPGGSAEKFKEISDAYNVLNDPGKKERYDKFGVVDGDDEAHHEAEDEHVEKVKPISVVVSIELADAYNGIIKTVKVMRHVSCSRCNGTGTKGQVPAATCKRCHGQGMILAHTPFGTMPMDCDRCDGEGQIVREKDKCLMCRGEKIIDEDTTIPVEIPKGIVDGGKVMLAGQGHCIPNCAPGDISVVVKINPSSVQRFGDHLLVEKEISLLEALCGFTFTHKHFDDRLLTIHCPRGNVVSPGDMKCVEHEGMPLARNAFLKGNLVFRFKVHFPKKLQEKELDLLEGLLGANRVNPSHVKVHDDDYILSEFKGNLEAEKAEKSDYDRMHDDNDEDEDDSHGGPGLGCKQM